MVFLGFEPKLVSEASNIHILIPQECLIYFWWALLSQCGQYSIKSEKGQQ